LGRATLIGGLIGAGFGLFLGIAASTDGNYLDIGLDEIAAVTGVVAAGGAGIGAIIGSLSTRDRWEPVPLPKRVTGNPQRSRTITPLTIRF
jgi:hypothetical protein